MIKKEINIYYRWFILWEWISQINISSKALDGRYNKNCICIKKNVNDSMFTRMSIYVRNQQEYVCISLVTW
jgi:hypothetical protein